MYNKTGYNDLTLLSLSTANYPNLEALVDDISDFCKEKHIRLSLPSLRIDKFKESTVKKLLEIQKANYTFAPETISIRMQNIINKNIDKEKIISTIKLLNKLGVDKVKLYFMVGLPFENVEDIEEIANFLKELHKKINNKRFKIKISVGNFVPKANTPFQWVKFEEIEELKMKINILFQTVKKYKNMLIDWSDTKTSYLESILARGDRRLAKVIYESFLAGEFFLQSKHNVKLENWLVRLKNNNIDIGNIFKGYNKEKDIFPWEHICFFYTKEYFLKEYCLAKKASEAES